MTAQPLDAAAFAAVLGLAPATLAKYRVRYAGTDWAVPAPDVELGGRNTPGWWPDTAEQYRQLLATRPGQGAGGGRPRKTDTDTDTDTEET